MVCPSLFSKNGPEGFHALKHMAVVRYPEAQAVYGHCHSWDMMHLLLFEAWVLRVVTPQMCLQLNIKVVLVQGFHLPRRPNAGLAGNLFVQVLV